jgi:hypothetical protein
MRLGSSAVKLRYVALLAVPLAGIVGAGLAAMFGDSPLKYGLISAAVSGASGIATFIAAKSGASPYEW